MQTLLHRAVVDGRLEHLAVVSAHSHPGAERSYLSDGSGVAWSVPASLRGAARFAVDAELVRPVRAGLVRRYGVADPMEFARRWTRAEALAKVHDVPIIVWLGRYGLDVPHGDDESLVGEWHWRTDVLGDIIVTRAALTPSIGRGIPADVGGAV